MAKSVKKAVQKIRESLRVSKEEKRAVEEKKILLMYDNIKYTWRGEQQCISLQRIAGLEYRRLTRNTKTFSDGE